MLINRPPIIVILGHVDHGKTTLLDYLRKTNIASREVGGITQHTRSFKLKTEDQTLMTFIDTPGHAAFSQMRSRGAKLADIALLVISGVDGIMPQTKESLDFINQSKIPFIVTITKTDLPGSDPDKIKTSLTDLGVIVEDLGGPIPAVSVSAKTGQGIPDLLETIKLISQLNPPQADPDGNLEALVLESRLDSQKGPLATVVVKNGTLKTGQSLFTQSPVGKIRALIDPEGQKVDSAPPSAPVEILGLTQVVPVGNVLSSQPVDQTSPPGKQLLDSESARISIVLKADVAGSLEAILSSLPSDVRVLSSSTGDITENDIDLAHTSGGLVVGFNIKASASVSKLAEVEKVPVHIFRIIYDLFESLEKIAVSQETEVLLGKAEVIAEFKIDAQRIAGCKCTDGVIKKGDTLRLLRAGSVVGETRFRSIKLGKTDTDNVKSGQEFGAVMAPFLDFKPGDTIIAYAKSGR